MMLSGYFLRVVIPHLVRDGQCALAIQGVEDVLVGEEQLPLVLHGKSKDLVGVDECFGPRYVHEDHAGVEVDLVRVEAHVVEGRCRMDRIGMGCGSEYAVAQYDVEERRERIDDEDVGVEIQGTVYVGVDDMRAPACGSTSPAGIAHLNVHARRAPGPPCGAPDLS